MFVVFVKYLNITSFFSQSQYYRLHLKLFTQAVNADHVLYVHLHKNA